MNRKFALGIILTFVVMGISSVAVKVHQVEAYELIYIREDGTIEPLTANITTSDHIVYNFTGNNYGRIEIERGNIVVDGFEYSLEGTDNGNGVFFRDVSNVTIKNLEIRNFDYGINIYNSSNNKFHGNNITNNNNFGFYIYDSSNNTIYHNRIMNNGGHSYGGHSAIFISYSQNNTIYLNNITENPYLNGVGLWRSSNNTIYDNVLASNYIGIRYDQSSNQNRVHGNNITSSNRYAIFLISSSNNTMYHNLLDTNEYGFYIYGSELAQFLHNIDASNLIDGKPIYYLINHHNFNINPATHSEIGFLALINSTSINIEGQNFTENGQGLLLAYTNNSRIAFNHIMYNYDGLELFSAFNNSIYENNLVANEYRGIYLQYSNRNRIMENTILNNTDLGIYVSDSTENTFYGNTIANSEYGIELYGSNNSFYLNNFVNNTLQIDSYDFENFWDNDLEGNYWSDYNGTDTDNDGIGEIPYEIDAINNDTRPLMGMFHNFNASLGYDVNVISNSTIESFQFFESNSSIKMFVSNMTSDQTFGFCRVCIPKDLMSPLYYVIIDDGSTEVFHMNDALYDNGTHRWVYFAYEHSIHEIDIIPEFPSFLLLPLFMVATLVAVVIYRKQQSLPLC